MKKQKTIISVLVFIIAAFIFTILKGNGETHQNTKLNITNKTSEDYKTVQIGQQIWMTENLKLTKFRNGVSIPQAKNAAEWAKAGLDEKPAWCYYKYDPKNISMGLFYNYYVISDSRELAPEGWHIPDSAEWYQLIDTLGADSAGYKMKTTTGWNNDLDNDGNGNNSSGFNGAPNGFLQNEGTFYGFGNAVCYWQKGVDYQQNAWYFELWYVSEDLKRMGNVARKNGWSKRDGVFVRCVRD